MQKNDIGKVGGVAGIAALIVTIVCQLFHNGGIPWIKKLKKLKN